jgi:hypothetical protein
MVETQYRFTVMDLPSIVLTSPGRAQRPPGTPIPVQSKLVLDDQPVAGSYIDADQIELEIADRMLGRVPLQVDFRYLGE